MAVGSSGGIAILWKPPSTCVLSVYGDNQMLVGIVYGAAHAHPWILIAVYASLSGMIRKQLWLRIALLSRLKVPVCVAGDFNIICSNEEKKGGADFDVSWEIKDFRDFLCMCGLIDPKPSGPPFTWSSGLPNGDMVMERLDRFLISPDWLSDWPSLSTSHLLKMAASDHCPILLTFARPFGLTPKPFRFEDFWLRYPDSWRVVQSAWDRGLSVAASCSNARRLSKCLYFVRHALCVWNRSHVANLFAGARELENILLDLKRKDMVSGLDDSDKSLLLSSTSLYNGLLRQQEIYWRQRSRLTWLAEGTRFFHAYASIRNRKSMIHSLCLEDGSSSSNSQVIMDAFLKHFKMLWGCDHSVEDLPLDRRGAAAG